MICKYNLYENRLLLGVILWQAIFNITGMNVNIDKDKKTSLVMLNDYCSSEEYEYIDIKLSLE